MFQLFLSIVCIISLQLHAVIVQNNSRYTLFAIENDEYYISMLDTRYHILPNQQMHIPENRQVKLIVSFLFNKKAPIYFVIKEFLPNCDNNNNAMPTVGKRVSITDDLILGRYLKHSV